MFPDMTKHPDYLRSQTIKWCDQLAAETGKYEFTWSSNYEGVTAEEQLTERLAGLIRGGRILDVGCGHGDYTNKWSSYAEEVVGYDMTEGFIATANKHRHSNVRYVVGNTKDGRGLPFPTDYFDVAYTKKGPTSWYDEGNRVVRPGGAIILLHPGDGNGEGAELGAIFPGLFAPPALGTPTLDRIQQRLEASKLTNIELSVLKETVWIPTAEDVLEMVCFGQSDGFRAYAKDECYNEIVSQFEKHAGEKGIKTTGFYYLIQANAT